MNDNPTQKGSTMNFTAILFHPGQVGMTAALHHELLPTFEDEAVFQKEMRILIGRHVTGDWGNVDTHDNDVNNQAVFTGARIMSEYLVNGVRVWIITDAAYDSDHPEARQVTTFLRPEDY
jgi:hypothetical protein